MHPVTLFDFHFITPPPPGVPVFHALAGDTLRGAGAAGFTRKVGGGRLPCGPHRDLLGPGPGDWLGLWAGLEGWGIMVEGGCPVDWYTVLHDLFVCATSPFVSRDIVCVPAPHSGLAGVLLWHGAAVWGWDCWPWGLAGLGLDCLVRRLGLAGLWPGVMGSGGCLGQAWLGLGFALGDWSDGIGCLVSYIVVCGVHGLH